MMEARVHTRTALTLRLGLALCVCLAGTPRSFARSEPPRLNRVQKVNVEKTDLGRVVDIACDSDPVFTVFRLADPVRIVIDIARGDVSKLDGPIEIDDGVVGDIGVAQFSDDRNALGRLIIGLDKAYDYEVKGNGTHVKVTVRGDGGPQPIPLAKAKAVEPVKVEPAKPAPPKIEPQKLEVAKTEAVKSPAVVAPSAAPIASSTSLPPKPETKPIAVPFAAAPTVEPKVELPKPMVAEPPKPVVAEAPKPAPKPVEVAKVEAKPVVVEAPKPAPKPVEVAKVEPAPVVAIAPPPSPPPTEKSVHELQSAPVDKMLERVNVLRKKNGSEVLVQIKGGKPTYEILELEDPPRVVFDFIGVATKLPKSSHWSLGQVGKLRLGIHHDKVRFVLDGAGGLPKYDIAFAGNNVRIITEVMPKRAEEPIVADAPVPVATPPVVVAPVPVPAPAPAPKPVVVAAIEKPIEKAVDKPTPAIATKVEPAPAITPPPTKSFTPVPPVAVVEAPKPEPMKMVEAPKPEPKVEAKIEPAKNDRIASLDFAKASEGGKLSFVAPETMKLDLDRSIARAPVLILSNAELSKDLEKSTDVSRLKTGLLRITSFNERKGKGGARIIANLATEMNHRTYRDGERVVWEFTPVVAQEPAVAVAPPVAQPVSQGLVAAPPPAPLPQNDVKISVQAPEVAGFTAEATQIVRSTSTAATGGRRLALDVRGADLLNVLRYISEVSGENIVAGDDVGGKITIRLRNVSWEQALDVVLKTKGFGRVRQGGIIRVAPLKKLQEEKEQELARIKAEEQVAPTFVRLIPVNYATAKDVLTQILPLLTKERGKATVDERTNTIVAEDLPDVLNKIENLAKRLDTQTPQVLIEARIVEANTQHVRDIGIQWGGSTLFSAATGNATGLAFPNLLGFSGGSDDANTQSGGTGAPPRFAVNLPSPVGSGSGGSVGMIFGNAANTALLSLRLSALENNGSVRIVSAPKVTTLDNVRAKISQGVSIPISVTSAAGVNTRFVDAFLSLEVKPHVTQDGSISMEIKASKNEPNFARTGAQGDPTIETKVAETQVLVKDGDTTVIGGIYTRNSSTTYNEVPFLSKIPVLGWLFKRKREEDNRAELLVFITPRIVNRQQSAVSGGGF